MPKVELTMNQWGLILQTIREKLHNVHVNERVSTKDKQNLLIVEDKIIDMAFKGTKEFKKYLFNPKSSIREASQRHY